MGNNKLYSEHFLMNKDSVKEYCVDYLKFFDDIHNLESYEIGDGNINYVFKVADVTSDKSIVIKQADKYLRSSGRPLDLKRNQIEAEILKIEGELAPGYVPEIYNYNSAMYALSMEDISAYKNLRKKLMESKTYDCLAEEISDFLAKTLLPSTDLVMDRHLKKEKVKEFINVELCDISEDLVFTEPYYNYKNRNIITKGNEDFVVTALYNNPKLKAEVGILRNNFMNNAQALIHGDLHSGSIFINETGIKVIDPEFAFYGPMGYDIGNVIGNLFFSLFNSKFSKVIDREFRSWLKNCISEIVDKTMLKLSDIYDQEVKFPLYQEKEFKDKYLADILSDSLGYAGTEIIRRTVGDSKVAEITMVEDLNIKVPMEQALVHFGSDLIIKRNEILSGLDLIRLYESVVSER